MEKDIKIQVKNLILAYGANKEKAVSLMKDGKNQEEILKESQSTVAVRDVSFDVYNHELLVVMGLSGSGKSSLIKCLNRLNNPMSGEILVDGEDVLLFDKKQLQQYRQRKACMVFQEFGLLPKRTVLQNVEFGLEVCKIEKEMRQKKAMEMIKLVGLEGWENLKPKQLSGGMQQRVGLARALANNPEILLMDEPFSALDPLIRNQMQKELLRIQKVIKKTIVFITHDIDEAFMLGDRIAILKDGELQQIGRPYEIMENPVNEYVADFTKDINKLRVYKARDLARKNITNVTNAEKISCDLSLEEIMKILALDINKQLCVYDENNYEIGKIDINTVMNVLK